MKRLAITLGAGLCLALGTALYTRAQDAPPAEPEYRSGSVLALNDWGAFESAMVEALASTGTPDPLVVILPQASTAPDAGAAEVKRFADLGMQSVRLMTELVGDEALNTFDAADVIWFADGDPDLLMKELAAAAVAHRFHQWRVSGKIIGAAGPVSAVLGFTYIHDAHDGHDHSHEHGADGEEEKPLMTHLAVKPVRGLGLWSGFIVPDALVRDRFALTASAVLDQPRLLAMCLGE
ncbi:MAG: hypothetical protein R3E96_12780, partial [Planctomycetota bacterium]